MYVPPRVEDIQHISGLLGVEFDPASCKVLFTPESLSSRHEYVRLESVGAKSYLELRHERYARPSYQSDPVDGVVDIKIDDDYNDPGEPAYENPDEDCDQTMHGLVQNKTGFVATYSPFNNMLNNLFEFRIVNGPEGSNDSHRLLGRLPGIDIPWFTAVNSCSRQFYAGEIAEAIANMKLLVPGIDNFFMAVHDMGGLNSVNHGLTWSHTHPAIYRHISRVAQGVVEAYGDKIHFSNEEERRARPQIVIDVAKALDYLLFKVDPIIRHLAKTELRIRDGRLSLKSNSDIVQRLLYDVSTTANHNQHHTDGVLFASSEGASMSERYRLAYWRRIQLLLGVFDSRRVLHEVVPHPEASQKETDRTLSIYDAVRKELQRRLDENSQYILA